jgi:hypothetical protein
MKAHRVVAFAVLVLSVSGLAQGIPTRVSFTANLKDASGPVSGSHTFVFKLYDAATGGTQAWTETWSALEVTQGLVFAELGATAPLGPAVLNGAALFLEVSVDGTVLSPRLAVTSAPYAVRAGIANTSERLGTLRPDEVQRRVTGSCPGAISGIDADGGVTCATPSGLVTADGLTGAGTSSSPLAVAFGASGTSAAAARSDHTHTPTLSCVPRAGVANNGSGTSIAAGYAECNPGEIISGGFCYSTYPKGSFLVDCRAIKCLCPPGQPCSPFDYAWGCTSAQAPANDSVRAVAMCCSVTVN